MDPLPVTSDFRAGGWTGFSRQGRRRRYNFRYHPLVLDYFKRLGDGQIDAFNNCNAWVLDALRDAGPNYLENNGVLNLMCAKDYSALLIPAREGMPVGTGYNLAEGNYSVTTGYKGDGSTMYIDSGRNNNAAPQNDMSLTVYITEIHDAPPPCVYIGGGIESASGSSLLSRSGANPANVSIKIQDPGGVSAFTGAGEDVGFLGGSRNNSSNYTAMTEQRSATITRNSATPLDVNLHVLKLNSTGSQFYCDGRLSIFSAGLSLDLTVMKGIQVGFMDRVLITSVYGDVWRGKDEATIQYLADVIRAGGGF